MQDATYASTSTVGAEFVVQPEAPPDNLGAVVAIIPLLRGRKTESGAGTIQAGVLVGGASGGFEAMGTGVSPTTSHAYLKQYPISNNPESGLPFTAEEAATAALRVLRET
jgi:hypothetical protein